MRFYMFRVVYCLLTLNTEACRLGIMLSMKFSICRLVSVVSCLSWLICSISMKNEANDRRSPGLCGKPHLRLRVCDALYYWSHACLSPPMGIAIAGANMFNSTPGIRHEYQQSRNKHVHVILMSDTHTYTPDDISPTQHIYRTRDYMGHSEQLDVIQLVGTRSDQFAST